jgi:hypothetical protein
MGFTGQQNGATAPAPAPTPAARGSRLHALGGGKGRSMRSAQAARTGARSPSRPWGGQGLRTGVRPAAAPFACSQSQLHGIAPGAGREQKPGSKASWGVQGKGEAGKTGTRVKPKAGAPAATRPAAGVRPLQRTTWSRPFGRGFVHCNFNELRRGCFARAPPQNTRRNQKIMHSAVQTIRITQAKGARARAKAPARRRQPHANALAPTCSRAPPKGGGPQRARPRGTGRPRGALQATAAAALLGPSEHTQNRPRA